MKKLLVVVLFLMKFGISEGQESLNLKGIKVQPQVCYALNEVHKVFVAPPASFRQNLKSGNLKNATIEVTYVGFSPEAEKAFQYAVEIWQSMIYSPVPIRVQATWESLDAGVLGSCGPSNFYKNFNSTEIWNCYYPIAIVEKMTGQDLSSNDTYDITGSFNKDFSNWYFGTDGNTPITQFDFVSVVLHELTHGLGFSGFFYTANGKGANSGNGSTAVFDQFVVNKNGDKLADTTLFPNNSIILNQNLTSGWLTFNTVLDDSIMPRLYAPSVYKDGSSIYHLDDETYQFGNVNSLMTPFSAMGEAIHDPGPATMAILNQIGWKSISMWHKPLKDIESYSAPLNFTAKVVSDFGLDSSKVYLVYSTNGFANSDSVLLKASATPDYFTANVLFTKDDTISYFFSATNIKHQRFVLPSNAPVQSYNFKIGVDTQSPVIDYDPIKYMISNNPSAKIDAKITDNIGVKSATVEYFVNAGDKSNFLLQNDTLDHFTGTLKFPAGSVKYGDQVSYRIVAVDSSQAGNVATSPNSGYYTFPIQEVLNPVDKYVTDFNTTNTDFIGSDFTIYTPAGFDNGALNSPHPYSSPEVDNVTIDYTTVLKYPIILKSGGKMSYDEIVLVEPGDPGNRFGDANFWDYVIVEGSKDGGINWKAFRAGYDSNAQKAWYDLYISLTSGQNSTAVPTKSLYVNRVIDLLANGNFAAGDTIQIRFRLFSDPYANGWGWIIDNLNIQDFGTATNPILLSSGGLSFYPNPANDQLTLQLHSAKKISGFILKAYNSAGILAYNQSFTVGSNTFQANINVSKFNPGLYLFVLEPDNGLPVTRKILVQ